MCGLTLRTWSYVVTGIGGVLLVVSFILAFYGLEQVVIGQVEDELILEKGNDNTGFEAFEELPIELQFGFYLFNITNTNETMGDDWKPKLQEIGPYVYREKRWKENITFSEDGNTVEFYQRKSLQFDQERSKDLTEDDLITLINMPLLGMMSFAWGPYASEKLANGGITGNAIRNGLVNGLGKTEEPLGAYFIRDSVRNFIFDGHKSVFLNVEDMPESIQTVGQLVPVPQNIFPDEQGNLLFGLYPPKPDLADKFTANTGKSGFGSYQNYVTWKGSPNLTFWQSDDCNRVRGTDGNVYKPFITKEDRLDVLTNDVCRTIYLTYEKEVSVFGIDGFHFGTPPIQFAAASSHEYNGCYCLPPTYPDDNFPENGCLRAGVVSLLKCMNVPVYLSMPHFLHGDPTYLAAVEGLEPDPQKHAIFLDVETWTGTPLRGAKRIQINFRLTNFNESRLEKIKDLPRDLMLPVLWVDEYGELTPDLVKDLKEKLLEPIHTLEIVKWVFVGLSSVVFAVGVLMFLRSRSTRGSKSKSYKS